MWAHHDYHHYDGKDEAGHTKRLSYTDELNLHGALLHAHAELKQAQADREDACARRDIMHRDLLRTRAELETAREQMQPALAELDTTREQLREVEHYWNRIDKKFTRYMASMAQVLAHGPPRSKNDPSGTDTMQLFGEIEAAIDELTDLHHKGGTVDDPAIEGSWSSKVAVARQNTRELRERMEAALAMLDKHKKPVA
jgi:seryl-tRNA synthetase